MKLNFLKILSLSTAVLSFSLLHAENDPQDQVIQNQKVVLNDNLGQEVNLAWAYRNANAGDVDYAKVLTDVNYANRMETKYNSNGNTGVVNWLVRLNGEVLANLPVDENVWTTFSRTAATHFGKKDYRIYDSPESKSTVLIVNNYWATTKLMAYRRHTKVMGQPPETWEDLSSLTELTDINLERIDPIYTKYLNKKYGPNSETATDKEKELYQKATHDPQTGAEEQRLGYTYKIDASLDRKLAKQAGVDYLFVVTPHAEVPKGMEAFVHSEQMFVGLKINDDDTTKFLRVQLEATQLIEK
jgi:hypothetical protein